MGANIVKISPRVRLHSLSGLFAVGLGCSLALGQTSPTPTTTPVTPSASTKATSERTLVRTGRPEKETLRKMLKPLTVTFTENSLNDVIRFITDATGAELEIMWADDRQPEGLDKEMLISLDVKNLTALTVLEKVLERAGGPDGGAGQNSWQMTDLGTMQIGPKTRLNTFKRVELYPIEDLLLEVQNFTDAPEFNLQTVLQGAQGGGGQSPFDEANDEEEDGRTREQKTQELIDVITQLVETEQWVDNGGNGGTIRGFQGSLIVNAPDYIHRQLNGYPYWPQGFVKSTGSRRYVGVGAQTATSQINSLNNSPVVVPPR